MPTYTVFVDRPRKIAELWPMVDEITSQHGVVTAAFVPAHRERAGALQHGALNPRSPEEIARLDRAHAARHRAQAANPTARLLCRKPITRMQHRGTTRGTVG